MFRGQLGSFWRPSRGVETLKAMPQMQRRWEEQLAGYVAASFKVLRLGNTASTAWNSSTRWSSEPGWLGPDGAVLPGTRRKQCQEYRW
jgi:hypothetical protein